MLKIHKIPDEDISTTQTWRLMGALVVSLVLLALLNQWYKGQMLSNTGARIAVQKWELAATASSDTEWLILGDSVAGQGVEPRIIEETLGGKCINLSTTGHMMLAYDAWILHRWLAMHGRPKGVIVAHSFNTYPHDIEMLVTYLPYLPREILQLPPKYDFSVRESIGIYATPLFPLYFRNRLLSKNLIYPWLLLTGSGSTADRYPLDEKGFIRKNEPGKPDRVARHRKSWVKRLPGLTDSPMSPENKDAFIALMKMADTHDFPVFWARSPLDEQLADACEYREFMKIIEEKLIGLAEGSTRFHMLNEFDHTLDARLLHDSYHVNYEGATIYTRALAESIRSTMCSAESIDKVSPTVQ